MKLEYLFLIPAVFAMVFFLVLVPSTIYQALQNEELRQQFCESQGFDSQMMRSNYHEGYCYRMEEGTSIKKEFLCQQPTNYVTETIGKCNFLEDSK